MLAVPWQVPPVNKLKINYGYGGSSKKIQSTIFDDLDDLKMQVGTYKLEKGPEMWRNAVNSVDNNIKLPLTISSPINRAYFKMVEIIRTCIIQPVSSSFHMCEAPGGFIQAVREEFKSKIRDIHCTSMVGANFPSFSAIVGREGVNVHKFENNDITNPDIRAMHLREFNGQKFELITADGAIDNDLSPETVEVDNALLIASEIALAIDLQKDDGCFVVKIFGLRESITLELIALLSYMYNNVQVVKPYTSRSVNDERYIICQGFDSAKKQSLDFDNTQKLTKICELDETWLNEMTDLSIRFANDQSSFLRKALYFNGKGGGKGKGRGRTGRGRGGRNRANPY